jgi:hypothetical protein
MLDSYFQRLALDHLLLDALDRRRRVRMQIFLPES